MLPVGDRLMAQGNRLRNLKTELHKCAPLSFDQGAKAIRWGRDKLLHKSCWNNWMSISKKMKKKISI